MWSWKPFYKFQNTNIIIVKLSGVKDPLADNTAQGSELVLIQFSGNNPRAKDSLVVNRQVKGQTSKSQSPRQKYPKHRIQTGSGQKPGKGQNHRQADRLQ